MLENSILLAEKEHSIMLTLFEDILMAEEGQGKDKTKKGKRRSVEDAYSPLPCPYCQRCYTTDSSMKRHIKLKHLDIGDDPPKGNSKGGKEGNGEEYYREDEDGERGRKEGEEEGRKEDRCTGNIEKER